MSQHIPYQAIRQVFVLLAIALLGGLIIFKLLPFTSGILGAITLYVIFEGWMNTFVETKKWKQQTAALVLMLGSFFGILIPLSGVIFLLGRKIGEVAKDSEKLEALIKNYLHNIEESSGIDLAASLDPGTLSEWAVQQVQSLIGTTADTVIAVALMYFLLYFMLIGRKQLRHTLNTYIPMNRDNIQKIGGEIRTSVRANAIGIPLVGLVKGVVGLIGFLIFGIEDPLFWFVILTITGMIPFIGTVMGILPVFLVTLASGHQVIAWSILAYGIIVVGMTDNIIRLYALRRLENIHPLITLIGLLVGVPLFGFIGLIFGPLIVSLFLVITKIYKITYVDTASE